MNKIFIIAPHSDDAELGCGGVISRFLKEGKDVYILVLSLADKATIQEFEASVKELGMSRKNVFFGTYRVREFGEYRQEILDDILILKKEINPDIVFLPSTNDFHQDHQVVCQEGIRAFKNKTIFGYEYPWNTLKTQLNCFYPISKEDLNKKIKALSKYKSQKGKSFIDKNFIRSWAEINGIKIGTKYAESFETIRTIQ